MIRVQALADWSFIVRGKPMKQILTRLSLTLPVVWLVVSLVFLLIHLVPAIPFCKCWAKGNSGGYGDFAPPVPPGSASSSAVFALLGGRCARRPGQFHPPARHGGPPDCRALPLHAGFDADRAGTGAAAGAAAGIWPR